MTRRGASESDQYGRMVTERPSGFAVRARGLVKRYGATTALAGIDFEVPTGTVTAVLGPNGAGKTTAVRILTTLADADEGEATVAGFDVAQPTRARSGAASAWPPRTPPSTRCSPAGRTSSCSASSTSSAARSADDRAAELLEEFSLADAADRRDVGLLRRHAPAPRPGRHPRRPTPRSCSSTSPRPASTPGPAPSCGRCSTPSSDRGTTLLLTTQYLEEAERLADDIIVIDHGRIIARGDARKLKREVGGDHLQRRGRRSARLDDAARVVGRGDRRRAPGRRRAPAPSPPRSARAWTTLVDAAKALADAGHRRRRPQPAPAHASTRCS